MSTPARRFLSEAVALAIHDAQIAEHGGSPGVRGLALVPPALDRPQDRAAYATPDAAGLAAAYAFGIARNHGRIDGNERTAFVAACVFLLDNGQDPAAGDADYVTMMRAVASGAMPEPAAADWFRASIRPTIPPP